MNPNIELFRRTAPNKKIEIIRNLTQAELFSITAETIKKMLKRAGNRYNGAIDLHIRHNLQGGNHWNSWIEGVELRNKALYLCAYVQYENTDTTEFIRFEQFMRRGEFIGVIPHTDYYGNPQTSYFHYDTADKTDVLRSICLEYVNRQIDAKEKKTIH